jgi:hypothetical protein
MLKRCTYPDWPVDLRVDLHSNQLLINFEQNPTLHEHVQMDYLIIYDTGDDTVEI